MSNGRIQRPEEINPRLILPRVGFIKTGFKTDKGLPTSTDYFIATGKYAELFKQAYGDKPNRIQIVFPADEAEKVCSERYEYRDDKGALVASGDGQTFSVWDGHEYKELTITDYPNLMRGISKQHPNSQTKKGESGWSVVLTLNFIIPCVRGVAGYWSYTTKGAASTIPQIRTVFDGMIEQKGYCKGIIFDLSVEFAKSQKPGEKSRYPVVSLIANESEENVKLVKQAYQKTITD